MKTLRVMAMSAACILAAIGAAAAGDSTVQRPIDAKKSSAQFSVQHVFVDRVTGSVPIQSGVVMLPTNSLVPISASAVLDATGIQTADHDQTNAIRGPDFLDVQRFPTWTFKSTKITPQSDSTFGMDGLLTMHGVTQPEHLNVTIHVSGQRAEYIATVQIDRHAFGMKIVPLDPAIGNIVEVTINVVMQ